MRQFLPVIKITGIGTDTDPAAGYYIATYLSVLSQDDYSMKSWTLLIKATQYSNSCVCDL